MMMMIIIITIISDLFALNICFGDDAYDDGDDDDDDDDDEKLDFLKIYLPPGYQLVTA